MVRYEVTSLKKTCLVGRVLPLLKHHLKAGERNSGLLVVGYSSCPLRTLWTSAGLCLHVGEILRLSWLQLVGGGLSVNLYLRLSVLVLREHGGVQGARVVLNVWWWCRFGGWCRFGACWLTDAGLRLGKVARCGLRLGSVAGRFLLLLFPALL